MAKLPTASQTALDELGKRWDQRDIDKLRPFVRTAFNGLRLSKAPDACVSSTVRVLEAVGEKSGGLETSTGDLYVRHMARRANGLATIMDELSLEARFGLIELSALTCIANDWELPDKEGAGFEPLDNPGACLEAVAKIETNDADCERWRGIVAWLRHNPPDRDDRVERRNVAWAITWCGVVNVHDEGPLPERAFTKVLGMKDHKEFNERRRIGVILIGTLLKFMQRGVS